MKKIAPVHYIMLLCVFLASCTATHTLPPFSSQRWHVAPRSGNAVSTSGVELGFGSEWMVTDTTLMQTPAQLASYPKLPSHLAKGIAQFQEIAVDSIYFYNPHRGLLFVRYHQEKPLKPTSEIQLFDDSAQVYSREYANMFGDLTTHIEDDGWENGPSTSVYSNVRYRPGRRQLVMLQRLPGGIAVIQICATNPRKGKWWEDYPPGTLWNIDLGDPASVEHIATFLQSSRTLAVSNLRLLLSGK